VVICLLKVQLQEDLFMAMGFDHMDYLMKCQHPIMYITTFEKGKLIGVGQALN
jgi:hypothetical protein